MQQMILGAHPPQQQNNTKTPLQALVDKLKASNPDAAKRLGELDEAIRGIGPDVDAWAASDIHEMIDPAAIVEQYKSKAAPGRVISLFEWARNILILAPLVITWLGIWDATAGYQALLSSDKNQQYISQPFLYLWQQGFYNHMPWGNFPLSTLALTDFFLLGFILLLTIVISSKTHVIYARREYEAAELRGELADALTGAALALRSRTTHQQQPADFTTVVDRLDKIATDFQQTTQQFLTELETERNQRGDLTAFTKAVEQIAKDMSSAGDSIKQTTVQLTVSIDKLSALAEEIPKNQNEMVMAVRGAVSQLWDITTALGRLIAEQSLWRQELQGVMAAALKDLLVQQEQSGQKLHDLLSQTLGQILNDQRIGQQRLQDTLVQLLAEQQKQGQQMQGILDTSLGQLLTEQRNERLELQDKLGQLLSEQSRLGQQLHEMLDRSLGGLLAEQGRYTLELSNALDTLDTTLKEVGQFVLAMEKATQKQGDFFATLDDQRKAQTDMANQVFAVAKDTERSFQATRDMLPELRSVAVDMEKIVYELKSVPGILKNELFDPMRAYSQAAANVADGGDDLKAAAASLKLGGDDLVAAATSMNQASKTLESVIIKLDGRLGT